MEKATLLKSLRWHIGISQQFHAFHDPWLLIASSFRLLLTPPDVATCLVP